MLQVYDRFVTMMEYYKKEIRAFMEKFETEKK